MLFLMQNVVGWILSVVRWILGPFNISLNNGNKPNVDWPILIMSPPMHIKPQSIDQVWRLSKLSR